MTPNNEHLDLCYLEGKDPETFISKCREFVDKNESTLVTTIFMYWSTQTMVWVPTFHFWSDSSYLY